MRYFLGIFVILFALFGCATTENQHNHSEKKSSSAFDFNNSGSVEKNTTENKGHSYQPSEYSTEDFQTSGNTTTTATENRESNQTEKMVIKEELQSVKGSSFGTFQLAMIQKENIKVLVNLSNTRALKQKIVTAKSSSEKVSEEMKERLEKFERESRQNTQKGNFVYVGDFKSSRKSTGIYFTGDQEAEKVKRDIQGHFFQHWNKISPEQAKEELDAENVMLCEMNGTYYKISRPAPGESRSVATKSQQLNAYANAKQKFMQALEVSLALPNISTSYTERALKTAEQK